MRPPHIAPLDEALDVAVASVEPAEQAIAEFLDEHLDLLDRYDELLRARADAYAAVHNIEDAIEQLGYCVLGLREDNRRGGKSRLGSRTYSTLDDRVAARARRDPEPAGSSKEDDRG